MEKDPQNQLWGGVFKTGLCFLEARGVDAGPFWGYQLGLRLRRKKTDLWKLYLRSCPGLERSLSQSLQCRGMYECHKHMHTLYNLHKSTWEPVSLEIQLLELVCHNLQPWTSALRAITIQTPGKRFSLLPPLHPGNTSHFLQVYGCMAVVTRVRLGRIGAVEVLK